MTPLCFVIYCFFKWAVVNLVDNLILDVLYLQTRESVAYLSR
jgi:hypothetical protein